MNGQLNSAEKIKRLVQIKFALAFYLFLKLRRDFQGTFFKRFPETVNSNQSARLPMGSQGSNTAGCSFSSSALSPKYFLFTTA